jgi:hypothetical protein
MKKGVSAAKTTFKALSMLSKLDDKLGGLKGNKKGGEEGKEAD